MGSLKFYYEQGIRKNWITIYLFLAIFGHIFIYFNILKNDYFSYFLNVLLSGVVFCISIVLIKINWANFKNRKKIVLFFVIFYFYYFLKSIYSFLNFEYINNLYNKIVLDYYYYSIFIIIVPVISLLLIDYTKINFPLFFKISFIFLLAILSINVLYIIFITKNYNTTSGIFRSYYILVGHYGTTLIIFSLYRILFLGKKGLINIIAILIGVFTIFISSARSPFLSLLVVTATLLVLKKNYRYLIYFSIFSVALLLLHYAVYLKIINLNFKYFIRINAALFEGNASGRSFYINKGIQEFLNYPIFGGRVLFEDGTYSHNFFLDIFMSCGIIGFVIFVFYYRYIMFSVFYMLKNIKKFKNTAIFVLLFLQYFILDQTSGVLYRSYESWYLGAVVLVLVLSKKIDTQTK